MINRSEMIFGPVHRTPHFRSVDSAIEPLRADEKYPLWTFRGSAIIAEGGGRKTVPTSRPGLQLILFLGARRNQAVGTTRAAQGGGYRLT